MKFCGVNGQDPAEKTKFPKPPPEVDQSTTIRAMKMTGVPLFRQVRIGTSGLAYPTWLSDDLGQLPPNDYR
jgi:hypothetical protein